MAKGEWTEEDKQRMEDAAAQAKKEFGKLSEQFDDAELFNAAIESLANWWKRNFPEAGHKRLAYILMENAEE